MSRILLVAADTDLRRSLDFALTAEGHEVTCRTSIGAHVRPNGFECTVIDHHAIGRDLVPAKAFCRDFAPVILLANSPQHPLAGEVFRTVLKPLLGAALTGAIHDAVQRERH